MEVSSFLFFLAGLIVSSITTIVLFHLFEVTSKKRDENKQKPDNKPKATVEAAPKPVVKESAAVPTESATSASPVKGSYAYRFEEENPRALSSEYTRRGHLWSHHASWHLPQAPRADINRNMIEGLYNGSQGLDRIQAVLQKYDVDMVAGFLPAKDPIQRLPYARYHLWEDLGDDLPKLLGARLGQAREPLSKLPILSTDKLITDAELRRAHLLLCLFAHAYVWGGAEPIDRIPPGIAVPLCEVSRRLDIPPVLGHPSIVLYNWRRLDAKGEICMENLATLNNFFDGRDESWFYLITVEIEAVGARAVVPTMLAIDAIQRYNEEVEMTSRDGVSAPTSEAVRYTTATRDNNLSAPALHRHDSCEADDGAVVYTNEALNGTLDVYRVAMYVAAQLRIVGQAIKAMTTSILTMREGCHPFIFYHRVRPFLSGWKHNPTMPQGVLYEGVSETPMQFYGGSAAQSALLPFLDIALGVTHDSNKSMGFLLAMRDYLTKPHRVFLEYLEKVAVLRPFITQTLARLDNNTTLAPEHREMLLELREVYDNTLTELQQFRSGHINLVAEYIIAQQRHSVHAGKLEGSAGGRGTGGTELMSFLKPIRDDCVNKMLKEEDRVQATATTKDAEDSASARSTIEVLRQETVSTATLLMAKDKSAPPAMAATAASAEAAPVSAPAASDDAIRARLPSDAYIKDNASAEDRDMFRGAARPGVSAALEDSSTPATPAAAAAAATATEEQN